MKGKRIGTSILAAIMLAGTTATSALAAMPDQTAVIGEKAFSLKYVNASENENEVREAIKEAMKAKKGIYVKARNVWYNNDESKLADTAVIPAVVYKTAEGEVSYEAGDGEEATKGFMIKEISATGVKTITVSFTEAVSKEDQEKASFVVKKGKATLTQTAEFNEEGTEAVLKLNSRIIKAEYAVEVKGLELEDNKRTISCEKERVEEVAILSGESVPQAKVGTKYKAFVKYQVRNQYGEKLNKTVEAYGPYGAAAADGVVTLSMDSDLFKNNYTEKMPLNLTLVVKDGTNVITELYSGDIVKPAKITESTFGKIFKVKDDKLVEITAVPESKDGTAYIKLDLEDQYGNKIDKSFFQERNLISKSNAELTIAEITSVTAFGNFSFVEGELNDPEFVFNPGDDESDCVFVKLTGKFDSMLPVNLVMVTGQDVNRLEVAVSEKTLIDQFSIEMPEIVAAGDTAEITIEAFDKNGDKLSDADLYKKLSTNKDGNKIASNGVNTELIIEPSVGTLAVAYDYVAEKLELTWAFAKTSNATGYDKTVSLQTSTQTHDFQTTLVQLRPQVKATEIALTDKKVNLMTPGATQTFNLDKNLAIYDQYGRKMKTKALLSEKITIEGAVGTVADDNRTWTFTGAASAKTTNATISLELEAAKDGKDAKTADVEVAIKTIKTADVKSIHMEADKEMYVGSANGNDTTDNKYAAGIEVYGKTSSGSKVVLADSNYTVKSDNKFDYAENEEATLSITGGKLIPSEYVTAGYNPFGDDKETEVLVYAISKLANATSTPTAKVKLTVKTPVLTTLKVKDDKTVVKGAIAEITVDELLKSVVREDQYGIALGTTPSTIIINKVDSSVKDIKVTNTDSSRTDEAIFDKSLANGDSFEVRFFFGTKEVTFKVIVDVQ